MNDTGPAAVAPPDNSPALGHTTDDLGRLLQRLNLLSTDADRRKLEDEDYKRWDGETPGSLQVIKSGATALTQAWTKWARKAGGAAAALSIISGGAGAFIRGLNVPVPVACALIVGGFTLAAAIAISVAVVINADLRARGIATAASTEGKAAVATEFLRGQTTAAEPSGNLGAAETALLFAVASRWTVLVCTKENPGEHLAVIGVDRTANGIRFVTATDVLGIDEIASWSTRG